MGASPAGGADVTGGAPLVPGVIPVDAGACADPGALGAVLVGSWEAAALVTVVAMACAAVGRSGSGTDGTLGRTGDLAAWRCSLGWLACAAFPAGVVLGEAEPEVVPLEDLALGAVGVPEGLVLPATRFASVGFVMCGLAVGAGVLVALGDSAPDGAVVRGISGSWCGSGTGAPGAPV
ncbi:hypothetical protein [Mycobacteroides abscessus]|uniref:hypothetical protein n=1 Tax=Mycobacteroides abscessus TaxID=36809 RepID=UPI001F34449B|nr:hypothetical protein [Mycobacteroides abscessus]